MTEFEKELAKECAKQIPVKEAYEDFAKPAAKASGDILGLVPRAINGALEPLHIWILQKEYNIERTKLILRSKLEHCPIEQITSPEPYIAVPVIQALSYCIDNEELRDMYANLLAASMKTEQKKYIHPAFVEIIKQLSPDEAKILRVLAREKAEPILWMNTQNNEGREKTVILTNFTRLGELSGCEVHDNVPSYVDNLERLKIINVYDNQKFSSDSLYDELINSETVKQIMAQPIEEGRVYNIQKGVLQLSVFGSNFCSTCVTE